MKKAYNFLKSAYDKKRLSHLYIFSGEVGTGKLTLAKDFAKMLLKPYDNSVNFYENIEAFNHPQIHFIEPDGASIKKQQILELQEEFSKTSLIKGPRIYIIEDVDLISSSAANSLLKFMEEPETNETYGLLLTSNLSNVIPTIISRAQNVKLTSLNKLDFINKLTDNDIELTLARNIALVTNSLDKALELSEDESFLKIVTFLETLFEKWTDSTYAISIAAYAELELVLLERSNYELFLEIMLFYFLEVVRYKTHQELSFEHLHTSVQNIAANLTVKQLESIATYIQDEITRQTFFINTSLSLDALILILEKSRWLVWKLHWFNFVK